MKVFNLTDVETDLLKQYQMSNQTIVVGTYNIAPGTSVDVSANDEDFVRSHLAHFMKAGAAAIDKPPEAYIKGKAPSRSERMSEKPKAEKSYGDRATSPTMPPSRHNKE